MSTVHPPNHQPPTLPPLDDLAGRGGGHDHQPGERYYQPFISPAEEMPKLTSEQKSKLAEIDGTEYDPLDEDVDTRANNLPTDDKAKFELLINCMDRMALGMVQQCNRDLGGDEHEVDNQAFVEMLESVRANFMHDCNGVRPNPENSSYQNMQLEIYDTLRTYSFGKFTDGGARNAIKYLVTYESDEERRDVEEQVDYDLLRDDERPAGVAGEIYRRLAEASKGAAPSRLAQLRVLSLNRILADGRRKVDRTYTPQRELGSNSHLARQ